MNGTAMGSACWDWRNLSEELARVREVAGAMPLLVPGVGAQGGNVQEVLHHGQDAQGEGLVISSSRAILFGFRVFVKRLRLWLAAMEEINKYR